MFVWDWSHDPAIGASYVRLSEEPIVRQRELVPDRLVVDVDAQGRPVGVEVLGPLSL